MMPSIGLASALLRSQHHRSRKDPRAGDQRTGRDERRQDETRPKSWAPRPRLFPPCHSASPCLRRSCGPVGRRREGFHAGKIAEMLSTRAGLRCYCPPDMLPAFGDHPIHNDLLIRWQRVSDRWAVACARRVIRALDRPTPGSCAVKADRHRQEGRGADRVDQRISCGFRC